MLVWRLSFQLALAMTPTVRFLPRPLAMALLTLLCSAAVSLPCTALSLQEVLEATVQRAGSRELPAASVPYEASSWLAGTPSVGLSYLDSDQRYGTDEAELWLNLPLKSGRRRRADEALGGLSETLDAQGLALRQLYFSGLLREVLWAYRLADARRRFAAEKRVVLLELEQRQRELLAASASSEYALLLLQTELVAVQVVQQEFLQEARHWLQRYRQLSGLQDMPVDIGEPQAPGGDFAAAQHPRLRALDLAYDQQRQLLRASSAGAADWNLSVTAKNLDTAGYDENQFGLGVEIPLSAFEVGTQSDNAQWRSIRRDYLLARDELLADLRGTWDALGSEQQGLREKQRLLERSEELAGRIAAQLAQLQASNEIGQEILLRRAMSAIDTRAAAAANRILLERNNAMLRQAAGLSL